MNKSIFAKIQGAYLSDNRTAVVKESNGSEVHLTYIVGCGWLIEVKLDRHLGPGRNPSLLSSLRQNASPLEIRSSKLDTVVYSSEGEIIFANEGGAFCITRNGDLVLESCTIPFTWDQSTEPIATFHYPRPSRAILGLPGVPGEGNRNGRRYSFNPSEGPLGWPLLFHLSPSMTSWLGLYFDATERVAVDLGEDSLEVAKVTFYGENPTILLSSGSSLSDVSGDLFSFLGEAMPPRPWQLGYHQLFLDNGKVRTISAHHGAALPCDGVHIGILSEVEALPTISVIKSRIEGKKDVVSPTELPTPASIQGPILHRPKRSEWTSLRETIDDLINYSISGIRTQGALIPGVFGHAPEDLALRYYQLGAFMPFFVGVTGGEGRDKTPIAFSERATTLIKRALSLRYSLAREWYSNSERAAREGRPVILPTFEPDCTLVRDQFLLFDRLLVAPVVERDQKHRQVYLPAGEWYAFGDPHNPLEGDTWLLLPVDERAIPVFVKAGTIVTRNVPQLTMEASLGGRESFEIYGDRYGNALGYWFQEPSERYILSSCNYSHEVMKVPIEDQKLLPEAIMEDM